MTPSRGGESALHGLVVLALVSSLFGCHAGVNGPSSPAAAGAPPPLPMPPPPAGPPLPSPAPRAGKAPRFLYAATERVVCVFAVDAASGSLTRVSTFTLPKPSSAARVCLASPDGRFLYVLAHRPSAESVALAVDQGTGALTLIPHGMDEVESTRLAFTPGGTHVIGSSMGPHVVYSVEPDGRLAKKASVFGGASDDVGEAGVFSPAGDCYYSMTGTSNLAMYRFVPASATLAEIGSTTLALGRTPHLAIDPTGTHVYASGPISGGMVTFKLVRDPGTGLLSVSGSPTLLTTNVTTAPISSAFSPLGDFYYVACDGDTAPGTLITFRRDTTTGALTRLANAATGGGTWSTIVDRSGSFIWVANAHGGDISHFTIDPATGLASGGYGVPAAPSNFLWLATVE